ncbi:putative cellulase precursor [Cercophora scortea]|uniref:cellulase n=1 Tax=Cercophora scortea TaxID=314031 RepID=A0AAE0J2Q7_9PEZI|nr:putative cellulase precursor [Cercophora scortea]
MKYSILVPAFAAGTALAEVGAWGQCGGNGWTGEKVCIAGYTCKYSNDWYSQCLPGTAAVTTTSTAKATTTTSTSTVKATTTSVATTLKTSTTSSAPSTTSSAAASGKLKWLGVNQSGAEFGDGIFPGRWGTEFIFPDSAAIKTLVAQGYNIFRVAFSMERLIPTTLTSAPSAAYLQNLTNSVNAITDLGAYAILDPHNFGRYYGNIITDTAGFQTWWTTVAKPFASNSKVIFDTNNEYHDMDQTLVLNLNQAAINGIRAAGATSQYIFVEGNSYSGAWTWTNVNTNLAALTDPQNKIIYEMHQYLDSDGSGTSATCVSTDIGASRIASATAWLRANGKQGIIGEFAGGANSDCLQAVTGLLNHLKVNSDVWLGGLWWAGGPWWGNYIYSFEPPSGTGYSYYNSLLKSYAP